MPGDVVIRVENLSKRYLLGQRVAGAGGLRHAIEEAVRMPFAALHSLVRGSGEKPVRRKLEEFWALRDVNFEIRRGEVVGIIGRNGAGKSTLLKLLSRITEPTEGRIGLKGRVASLLEVGTGFHPELTGRENVFLNGAVLGMKRREVKDKFDEIVAFAGIEKFLDTPVKRYSSGMYVRLAFAVAAHLEPEILVVDEVLAVGDTEFQKKCLGKMQEVSSGGRTVLFVSHNLPAVASLCSRGIFLQSGRVVCTGGVEEVLHRYQSEIASVSVSPHSEPSAREGYGTHRFVEVTPTAAEFPARSPMQFRASIRKISDEGNFHFSLHFRNEWDVEVFTINSEFLDDTWLRAGDQEVVVSINEPWLPPGDYRADAYLHCNGIIDKWPDACRFRVGSAVGIQGYSAASAHNAGLALADFRMDIQNPGPR